MRVVHSAGKALHSQVGGREAGVVEVYSLEDLDIAHVLATLSFYSGAHFLTGADDGASRGGACGRGERRGGGGGKVQCPFAWQCFLFISYNSLIKEMKTCTHPIVDSPV
jgi:hypothetical protein